jgi:dCMP deaminase
MGTKGPVGMLTPYHVEESLLGTKEPEMGTTHPAEILLHKPKDTMTSLRKWDLRFIELAKHISQWSKDPSTQVGAVIVDKRNRVISMGYNGFPRGVKDSPARLNDREVKYSMVVHGEINALLFATQPLDDSTLYLWPFLSCSKCTAIIINAGIKRVVAPLNYNPRWEKSIELSQTLYHEAGVMVVLLPGLVEIDPCG